MENRKIIVAWLVLTILPKVPDSRELDWLATIILDFNGYRTFRGAGLGGPVMQRITKELAIARLESVNRVTVGVGSCTRYENEPVSTEQTKGYGLKEGGLSIFVRRTNKYDIPLSMGCWKVKRRVPIGTPVYQLD